MNRFYFLALLVIVPLFSFSQTPQITGVAIDSSNYKFVQSQIKMETLFIENGAASAENYFNRAKLYLDTRNYELALDDFNEAALLLPDEVSIYYYRGSAYDHLGNYANAVLDFSRVIELKPDWEWGYLDRGLMYFELEEYNLALKDFNRTLMIKPDWTVALTNVGKVYVELKQNDKAINFFNLALKSDAGNYLAYQNLGFLYFTLKKYDLAIENYTAAIDLYPKYYNAIRSRADAYMSSGNIEKGCDDVRLAASLGDPKALKFLKDNAVCD